MKKRDGILDAIAFLISVPFGAAGAALQYTVCQQANESKGKRQAVQKLKEIPSAEMKLDQTSGKLGG
ncbi:MAG: hypothetical protein HY913_19510 [Desulfomonile tiedjei]|nr:hypothetical protein [Desulfomonile tiedjei]